jgi:hypothetical protein
MSHTLISQEANQKSSGISSVPKEDQNTDGSLGVLQVSLPRDSNDQVLEDTTSTRPTQEEDEGYDASEICIFKSWHRHWE